MTVKQKRACKSAKKPELNPDYFLTAMARQLAKNYRKWPRELIGSRVFFEVDSCEAEEGTLDVRTLAFDAKKPRLFTGYQTPNNPDFPYLRIAMNRRQLAGFFTGRLDMEAAENRTLVFEGNSEALYQAVGRCLA